MKPVLLVLAFGVVMAAAAVLVLYEPAGSGQEETGRTEGGDILSHAGPRSLTRPHHAVDPGKNGLSHVDRPPDSHDAGASGREEIVDSYLTSLVRGTVKDLEGRPVPEAKIVLLPGLPPALRDLIAGSSYSASAESGRDGRFEIPLPEEGVFRLEVTKDTFADAGINVVLPGDDLTVVLEPGRSLEGEVRDAVSGELIPGVAVRARHFHQTFQADSAGGGTFSFSDLPEGIYSLEAFHEKYDVERLEGIVVSDASGSPITLELQPGTPVKGRVSALATREPVADAGVAHTILFRGEKGREEMIRQEAVTDADGLFFFESYSRRGSRLEVIAPGYSPGAPEPFVPPEEGKDREIEIEVFLKKECGVAGRVLDPDGNPLKGATVRALKTRVRPGLHRRATTDAEGSFRLSGLDGDAGFALAAFHSSHGTALSGLLVAAQGEVLEGVELRLMRFASIRGVVSGPDGRPFQGARVALDGIRGFMKEEARSAPMVISDEEGRFLFEKLVPGKYRLAASRNDLRSAASELTLLEGESLDSPLTLENGLALSGLVVDPSGQPVDDVLVTAAALESDLPSRRSKRKETPKKRTQQNLSKKVRSAPDRSPPGELDLLRRQALTRFRGTGRSDEDGRFFLAGLREEDDLVLTFRRYGFLTEVVPDISPSQGEIEIILKPEAALQGRVADFSMNRPLERYRVEWVRLEPGETGEPAEIFKKKKSRQSRARSVQSLDGTFLIEGVEAGEVVLRVSAKGFRSSEPRRLFVSPLYGAPFQSFLLDKGGVVTGKVAAADSSAVEGIPVFLQKVVPDKGKKKQKKNRKAKKQKNETKRIPSQRTDKRGRFQFGNLPEGSYRLLVGDAARPLVDPVNVRLRRGDNASKTIILRDLSSLEVRVTGKAGSCKADVKISGGPAGTMFRRKTGNLGFVAFHNLLPGKYRLLIQARGYKSFSESLRLEKKGRIKKEVALDEREPR